MKKDYREHSQKAGIFTVIFLFNQFLLVVLNSFVVKEKSQGRQTHHMITHWQDR